MIQRSDEWFAARIGKVTASRVADIIARNKNGDYSARRKKYMTELMLERITGKPFSRYQSQDMAWGVEYEEKARSLYAEKMFYEVQDVGFIDHPKIKMFGASPDGLIDKDGGLEIKCPTETTHFETLLSGEIDPDYLYQIHSGIICAGRDWWDFVSYEPNFPEEDRLFIKRVFYNQKMEMEILSEVTRFLSELEFMETVFRKRERK